MQAVTFDFYGTLVYHRARAGRGAKYREYLAAAGLAADPWEHRVLYDAFEYYGDHYSPTLGDDGKRAFWIEFTRRLFELTRVRKTDADDATKTPVDPTEHADAICTVMGPECLALFDDALPVLDSVRERGLRVGVISDWQRGLAHFCQELGIAGYLDLVVCSAEVGYEKPDPRLFEVVPERLGIAAGEILHVGDSGADVEGAEAAGFSAVLLVRGEVPPSTPSARIVRNLEEFGEFLGE